jgi:predicted TPR repeat methyltransferase
MNPGDQAATALLDSALNAHRNGRYDEAESHYREILQHFPEHPAATHFLGIIVFEKGNTEQGINLVRQSIDLAPDTQDWYNDLGNMLAAAQLDDDAVAAFMAALQIDPNKPVIWNNLGAVLLRAGQLEEALLTFENATALDPAFEDALNNLGNTLTQLNRTEAAARAFCAAYILNPTPEKPKKMLGIAYYTLGRIEEAAQTYRAWLAEDPGNPTAQHMLAACSGEGVPERADDAYIESTFDHYASTFESKLVDDLAYKIPELIGQALNTLGIPAHSLNLLDAGCGTGLCGPQLAPFSRHMTGVDLSAKCLEVAAEKAVYDELVKAELVAYLSTIARTFNLIVVADTLIYFGNLEKFMRAAAHALDNNGLLIASFEELESADAEFTITPSGRYSHSRAYLEAAFRTAGFEFDSISPTDIRTELGQPIKGLLVVARKHD